MLFGIDYGSRFAGTTSIAYLEGDMIRLINSSKKQDADEMILTAVQDLTPEMIGIDAPLSLPGAYVNLSEDYFYRDCDKALKAMSPMFLGGLTARAMRLNAQLNREVFEVYPGALARQLNLVEFSYKKSSANYQQMLDVLTWKVTYEHLPRNNHQFDAILALYIVWKIKYDQADVVGVGEEGLIYY